MYRVVQTVAAFEYPAGKVWGPYTDKVDADQRVATLRSFSGDGVIEEGDFGTPCRMTDVRPSGDPSALLAAL
jgi:hypothetical protein